MQAGRGLTVPVIERGLDDTEPPLSYAQESLWFLHQLNPESASYNSAWVLDVQGPLDSDVMEAVLTEVVRRHEILRTCFPSVGGRPVQRVMPLAPVRLVREDLRHLPQPQRSEEARRRAREEIRRSFDLAAGPLLRAAILRTGDEEHVFLLSIHHIACDAWSLIVLQQEVTALYAAFSQGLPSPLPELPLQYADFARWQRRWLQGKVLEDRLAFWTRRLAGAPPEIELPQEANPAAAPGVACRYVTLLPAELAPGLHDLCRRHGATLYMTLLAAFGVLLARSAEQDDIVIGTPAAGRGHAETEGLIGLFINMLPLRLEMGGGRNFSDLLAHVREVALDAYMQQGVPFTKLVEALPQARPSGRNPIFQVAFGLENLPRRSFGLPGLTLALRDEVGHDDVRFDLTFWISDAPEGLRATWTGSSTLFRAETLKRWHDRFVRLLRAILANPETSILALEMLSEEERQELESSKKQRESTNLARLRGMQRRSLGA
jgi:hypothetical protein